MNTEPAKELTEALAIYQALKAGHAPTEQINAARRRYEYLAGELNADHLHAALSEKESTTDG